MLLLIIRHEWRLLLRARTFSVCLLVLAAITAFAARNGAAWAREHSQTIEALERHDAENYARIKSDLSDLAHRGDPRPALNAAGMVWYLMQPGGATAPAPHIDPRRAEAAASEWVGARFAVLPPARLAALSIGQSDLHPYYSRITIRTRPILVHSDEIENPANLVNGRFDLAFVLTFCWPLLVLPLAYDLLSQERDNGTLALVQSQPVSLRQVLIAKLLVRGGSMVVITCVAALVGLIAIAGVSARSTGLELLTIVGLIAANGVFWFGLAAWINTRPWRSPLNAMVLTAAWIAWLLVIPTVVSLGATMLAPVPSRIQLINDIRMAGNLAPTELAQLMSTYQEEHPDVPSAASSADVVAIRGLVLQDEVDRRIEPTLQEYRAALERQQRWVERLRFASPAILLSDALNDLAGTSTSRYRRFARQLDDYHRAWRGYFYPLVHRQVSLTAADYDRAPVFRFHEEERAAVLSRTLVSLLAISVFGAVALGLAYVGVER